MNQPKPRRRTRRTSRQNRSESVGKRPPALRSAKPSQASNASQSAHSPPVKPSQVSDASQSAHLPQSSLPQPSPPQPSPPQPSPRLPQELSVNAIRPEISAITQYLVHESTVLDLIAIAVYQHLIESYGTELDQAMTSDTILTTLKNWAGEQCDRHNLWNQTAEDISSTLVSQALQAMQRDLGDRVLESLDWGEFNQILLQYMFEYPTMDLKQRLKPLEESYAQQLAQWIIQEMDLGNQSISLLKRRLGLASRQEPQAPTLVGSSLSNVSPIAELASELPLLVQEGEDGTLSFSDQFQADLWSSDAREIAYVRYHAKQNRHQYLEHYITSPRDVKALPWELVEQIRLKFGLNAAKLQLLLSAYATQYPRWDQAFTLTASNLIEALGWPSRHSNSHPQNAGNPTRDYRLKNKAANLLYSLSCVLVKLVWVDYNRQDSLESFEGDELVFDSLGMSPIVQPQVQSRGQRVRQSMGQRIRQGRQDIGRSPVGKLWDVMITPQGSFDRQSGEIETVSTVLLTVRPGLWVELLDGGYNSPPPGMDMALTDGSSQSLNQFGSIALQLLQLDAYSHELTIRMVIYLMLDAVCRIGEMKTPVYEIKVLLEQVMPDAIALAQTNIKQGQKLFEDWNITLRILAQLVGSGGSQTLDCREIVSHPDPTSLYVTPYPKWLNPESSMRKPRGWVQMWLSQKIELQLMG